MLRYELAVTVTLCIVMYKCTCYSRVEYLAVGSAFNLIGCTLDLLLIGILYFWPNKCIIVLLHSWVVTSELSLDSCGR